MVTGMYGPDVDDFTDNQIQLLRDVYESLQQIPKDYSLSNTDYHKFEKLIADFGERFPYVKPERDFLVSVKVDLVIRARCQDQADDLFHQVDYDFNGRFVENWELSDYEIIEQPANSSV